MSDNPIGDEGALALACSPLPLTEGGTFRDLGTEAAAALKQRLERKT